jgi:Domain of unknown function (DUF5916)
VTIPLAAVLLALDLGVPHTHATRAAAAPVIDGRLDDAVWNTADLSQAFTQQYPLDGQPPSERTTMRVLYDDDALYIGFDCEQTNTPIFTRLTRRDRDSESEWISVQIDPRREGKAAFAFGVNVSGVLVDGLVTEPLNWNFDWDENWEARTARTATGWSAEFRIPLRVLRFDATQPVQSWGLQAIRYIAQHQEFDLWSYFPRDVANPLGHAGRLDDLRDLKAGGALELRPFATAQGRRLDATSQTSASGYDAGWSAGLDLKWHIAQDLTLDAAVAPDFAQVEADQVILNLTNYETFLPEKRPLFLEGTEVFSFPLQIFYSRRIGSAPPVSVLDGERLVNVPSAATIYGAGKLVGRLGQSWTIGALSALTGRNEVTVQDMNAARTTRLVAPVTAFNVFRLRRELGASGHVGVMGTAANALGTDGGYPASGIGMQLCPSGTVTAFGTPCFHDAYVGGVDGLWRSPSGDYVASGAFIQSLTRGGPSRDQLDGTKIPSGATAPGGWLRIAKEGGKHLLWSAAYTGAGRYLDYNDLGFMPRQNLHELKTSIGYRTLDPGRFTIETNSALEITQRRSLTGLDLGQLYELNTRLRLQNLWNLVVAADLAPARFDDREIGDGAALERGRYAGGRLELGTDPKRRVVVALSGQAQAIQNDARAVTTQGTLTLAVLPQFDISLTPQLTWSSGEPRYASLAVTAGDPYLFGKLAATSVGATLRASYTFAPRLSLQAYAQAFLATGHFTDLRSVSPALGPRISLDQVAMGAPFARALPTPDFEEAALNLNVVFRWEYRLGSTLFIVYSRSQVPTVSDFGLTAGLEPRALGRGASADVILVKLSYWWSS